MNNQAYQVEDGDEENKIQRPFSISGQPEVNGLPTSKSNDYLVPVNTKYYIFNKLRRPKSYKYMALFFLILAVTLLIAFILLLILYSKRLHKDEFCMSDECLRSATNFKYSMDYTKDPCDNFYQHVCGHWSSEHPNHGWYPSFSSFSLIRERIVLASMEFLNSDYKNESVSVTQAKMLYESCLDTESAEKIGFSIMFKYIEEVGLPKVPTLFSSLSEEEKTAFTFDWLPIETKIKKVFSKDVFMGFGVLFNAYNVTENVMYIGTPGNDSPLPSPLRLEEKHKRNKKVVNKASQILSQKDSIRKKVFKYVTSQILQNITGELPKEEILEHAAFVVLNISSTLEDLTSNFSSNMGLISTNYTFKDLQEEIDAFTANNINKNMSNFLEKYVGHMFEDTNVTIDFEQELLYVLIGEKNYILHALTYLMDTSDIYLELYLWWSTVLTMIMNTTPDISDAISKEIDILYPSSVSAARSRSLDCVEITNDFMGMAVSYGIADKIYSNKSDSKIRQMIGFIKDAFKVSVHNLRWMDKETKKATYEKTKSMYSFIGYPDWLFKKGKLEEHYGEVEIDSTNFLQNMLNLVKSAVPKNLLSLRKTNKKEFSVDPIVVNAFNSFYENSIYVPLGILTFPMYHLGLEFLNYGAIGSVLGHELIHGFDNLGRKHDKYGNYKQWWSEKTIKTFENKTECFIQQYSNVTVDGTDDHISGTKTLGENIADNGGLNQAFAAYKRFRRKNGRELNLPGFKNYTHEQLFFIAFGSIWCETISSAELEDQLESDEHSPNSIRVNLAVSNSPDFARSFNCPAGSKMNPINKCKIW